MSFWVLYERVLRRVGEFEGARGSFLAQGKVPLPPLNTIKQSSTDLCRPLSVMTCQQGGFHGMDGLCLCGILSFFNKARFIMKLLEKARAAG